MSAFVNLFQNAIWAIQVHQYDAESPTISVKAEVSESELVVVRVRDNGCGVSKEDIYRIFDPFFTKNDVGEGMGLGLSIIYRIIEQHRARVEVESEVGEFTEFTLYVPLKSEENHD